MASEIELLENEEYINLATFRRSGEAVETPVWFAATGERNAFFVFTDGTSGKVKRLRVTDRVRVAPCKVHGKLKGDWIEGTCEILEDPVEAQRGYDALNAKYGWKMRSLTMLSTLGRRVGRRAVLKIWLQGA